MILNFRIYIKIKIMKTKQLFFAIVLILFAFQIQVTAQDQSSDKIKSIKIAYITERLNLTPQEAEVFWPVYNDFENRKHEINHSKRELAEQFMKNQDNFSDAEITKMLDDNLKYSKEETELLIQFDARFREILPPGKVFKLYVADVQFRNYLINKFKEQHGNPNRERD
jgi:hypothetical protein